MHSEGRDLIRNIINVCEEENWRKSTIIDLQKAMVRVALYANISEKTAVRIKKEEQKFYSSCLDETSSTEIKLTMPGKKRKCTDSSAVVDDFNLQRLTHYV